MRTITRRIAVAGIGAALLLLTPAFDSRTAWLMDRLERKWDNSIVLESVLLRSGGDPTAVTAYFVGYRAGLTAAYLDLLTPE